MMNDVSWKSGNQASLLMGGCVVQWEPRHCIVHNGNIYFSNLQAGHSSPQYMERRCDQKISLVPLYVIGYGSTVSLIPYHQTGNYCHMYLAQCYFPDMMHCESISRAARCGCNPWNRTNEQRPTYLEPQINSCKVHSSADPISADKASCSGIHSRFWGLQPLIPFLQCVNWLGLRFVL